MAFINGCFSPRSDSSKESSNKHICASPSLGACWLSLLATERWGGMVDCILHVVCLLMTWLSHCFPQNLRHFVLPVAVTLHSLTALFRPLTFSAVLLGAQGVLCFNYTPPVTNGGIVFYMFISHPYYFYSNLPVQIQYMLCMYIVLILWIILIPF